MLIVKYFTPETMTVNAFMLTTVAELATLPSVMTYRPTTIKQVCRHNMAVFAA